MNDTGVDCQVLKVGGVGRRSTSSGASMKTASEKRVGSDGPCQGRNRSSLDPFDVQLEPLYRYGLRCTVLSSHVRFRASVDS
jgi:hypothetical protein